MYDSTKPYKKQILSIIKQTWETPYVSVRGGISPIIKKKFSNDVEEISHVDGTGTKGFYHWQQKTFENAAIDSLAMNLNDLAMDRAVPYALEDHIFLPEDDKEAIISIIESLKDKCIQRNIAIVGGETSIHNNMDGLDISITMNGFVKNSKPNKFQPGDYLIGLKSNGLHSNGFTKVREVFKEEFKEEFINPTKIYLETILQLDTQIDIHGMMHITGGAFTKLKDILDNNDAIITKDHKLKPHNIFNELYSRGVCDEEMYKTFNCGIGFIFSVPGVCAYRATAGLDAAIIGNIMPGSGKVKVQSMFSNKEVEY